MVLRRFHSDKCRHLLRIVNRNRRVCLRKSSRNTGGGLASIPSFFTTTPIFYVNSAPHLGHLHSAVMADAAHRLRKMLGTEKTIFSTGTDEHGLKIQQAASNSGESLRAFCDNISGKFLDIFNLAEVDYTDFIRTTQDRHVVAVKHFWKVLQTSGNVYKGNYEGWYCVAEETFLPESQVKEVLGKDGQRIKVSVETGHPVEWTEESNYMFSLTKFQDDLLHWLRNSNVVKPDKFYYILKRMIEDGIPDLSISRSKSRLQWGISVPEDNTQTIYVWLDALINYLTVAGYPNDVKIWPPDVQVIGKDILKFHGIYWPSLLMAVGLEPPRKLICHSHWLVDHEKMSKSKWNIVDPFDLIRSYSVDAVRYFLLREAVPHSDANYSEKKLINVVNAELGDTLGNLLNRCTSGSLNPKQMFPEYKKETFQQFGTPALEKLIESFSELPETVKGHYLDFNYYKGVDNIMRCLRQANAFVEESKPWDLKADPAKEAHLDLIVHCTLEVLRVSGIMLSPIVPSLSSHLLNRIGVPNDERRWQDLNPFSIHRTGNPAVKGRLNERPLGPKSGVIFKKIPTVV